MGQTVTTVEPLEIEECYAKVTSKFEKPKYEALTFTGYAYLKLMYFIHLVGKYEVSGYGKIVEGKIVDLFLPKQTLSSATATIDEDAMVEFLSEIPSDELKYWELDWHSHVEMSATPSATDKTNYQEQADARGNKQFVAMIVNKSENIWCKDVISGVKFSDISLTREEIKLSDKKKRELYEECKAIVLEKCHKRLTVTIKTKEEEQEEKERRQLSFFRKDKKKHTCKVCGKELRDWETDKCWECKRDETYESYNDYLYDRSKSYWYGSSY